jgi:hypothetical protein
MAKDDWGSLNAKKLGRIKIQKTWGMQLLAVGHMGVLQLSEKLLLNRQ